MKKILLVIFIYYFYFQNSSVFSENHKTNFKEIIFPTKNNFKYVSMSVKKVK